MNHGILPLGRSKTVQAIGFGSQEVGVKGDVVSYEGDGHLLTVAPTGAGKGVSCVIPALATYKGSVVVLDVKGENYVITRRRRRELGQTVVCLDPFGVVENFLGDEGKEERSGFNPFDLLPYLARDRDTACRMLAEMLIRPDGLRVDPFWRDSGVNLLAALIDFYDKAEGPSRSLGALVMDLNTDVPESSVLGTVSKSLLTQAAFAHDVELMEKMEAFDLPVSAVMEYYSEAVFQRSVMEKIFVESGPELIHRALQKAVRTARRSKKTSMNEIVGLALMEFPLPVDLEQLFVEELQAEGYILDPSMFSDEEMRCMFDTVSDPLLYFQSIESRADATHYPSLDNPMPLALHRLAHAPGSMAQQAVAMALSCPDKTWGSILSVLRSTLSEFAGRDMARFLAGSFDLNRLVSGEDVSIYLAFPPAKIRAHPMVFRTVIEGAINILLSRRQPPSTPTLFLLDEVAQLGRMEFLITSKTLLRGYGVQVWTFWQDFSQLQAAYPDEWPTLLNNSRVIQLFGRNMSAPPARVCESLGFAPEYLMALATDSMMVWKDSPSMQLVERIISYRDSDFAPFCDPGPFGPAGTFFRPIQTVAEKEEVSGGITEPVVLDSTKPVRSRKKKAILSEPSAE